MIANYTRLYHPGKSSSTNQTFNKQHIEECLSTATLLAEPVHRKSYVYHIKKFSDAPDEPYSKLYLPLIENLASYLQDLPDAATLNTQHFSQLLDNALARAYYGLILRQYITLPSGGTDQQIQEQYPLWTYVVCSSAALWQIGKLHTEYDIALCNAEGTVHGKWDPLQGPLIEQSTHYRIQDINPKTHRRHDEITPLIARQIMPEVGFKWIASNPMALDMWLAALSDTTGATGITGLILSLISQLIAGTLTFNELMKQLNITNYEQAVLLQLDLEEAAQQLQHLHTHSVQAQSDVATATQDLQAGKDFLTWLRKGLADGSITVNQANSVVHMGSDGAFLLYPQIFQDFSASYPRYKDWIVVHKQFNLLGLTKLSGSDLVFSKYFSEAPEASQKITSSYVNAHKVRGVVVSDASTLFGTKDVPAANPNLRDTPPIHQQMGSYPTLPYEQHSLKLTNKPPHKV